MDYAKLFGCPPGVAHMMATIHKLNPAPQLLKAVMRLGPGRVQWIGGKAPNPGTVHQYTAWAWKNTGYRARLEDLLHEAAIQEVTP